MVAERSGTCGPAPRHRCSRPHLGSWTCWNRPGRQQVRCSSGDPWNNAYARRALQFVVEIVTSAAEGQRNHTLTERCFRCRPACVGRAPRHRRRRRRPVSGRRSLRPGSARKPQHHRIGLYGVAPPTGAVDVPTHGGVAKEPFRCRGEPRQNGAGDNAGQRRRSGQGQSHQPDERTVALVPASTIKPRAVSWVWEERLPRGALALMVGREAIGKSTPATTFARRSHEGLCRGIIMGYRGGHLCRHRGFLGAHHRARLMAAEADLDLVFGWR